MLALSSSQFDASETSGRAQRRFESKLIALQIEGTSGSRVSVGLIEGRPNRPDLSKVGLLARRSVLTDVSHWSVSVEPLHTRIDSVTGAFEFGRDFSDGLSGFQQIVELLLFARRPRSHC
jgi:hypothetical protein